MQLLEAGRREGHWGHEQGHITLLPKQPAPLVEQELKQALHLQRPLKVQQALPSVVLLPPCRPSSLQACTFNSLALHKVWER